MDLPREAIGPISWEFRTSVFKEFMAIGGSEFSVEGIELCKMYKKN